MMKTGVDDIGDEIDAVTDVVETISDEVAAIMDEVFGSDDDYDDTNTEDTNSQDSNPITTINDPENTDTLGGNNNNNSTPDNTDNTSNNPETTNETTNGDSETNPDTPAEVEKDVFIVYNGKQYKHGDIIEVPYKKENSHFAFTLKNYPENANLNWQALHLGTDTTSAYAQNETIHEIFGIDMKSIFILDIVANYNDKKIQVTIKRKSKGFNLLNLYARPENNENRIAKSGQILYLINSPKSRKINYGVYLSEKLKNDEISSQDIQWFYESPNTQTNLGKDFGSKKIQRRLKKTDNAITTSVKAGSPNLLEKSVDIVWFDKDYSKTKFSLGSDSNPIIKKAFEATKLIENSTQYFDKIPFIKRVKDKGALQSGSIGWYFNIIPFEQILENKEDKSSRLYFTEKKTRGGFDLGLKGSVDVWTLGLPFDKLPFLPDWAITKIKEVLTAEVSVVAKADAGAEIMAESIEEKWINTDKWAKVSSGINPAALSLKLNFGVESEFSILKQNDWFAISGTASGLAKAEIVTLGWINNDFSFVFLREGVWIDITAAAYVRFMGKKLETTPYYEKIQLIDPF